MRGVSRIDTTPGDSNWPWSPRVSIHRDRVWSPKPLLLPGSSLLRLTGRSYSKRFFEILKGRRKLPCRSASVSDRSSTEVGESKRLL